MPPRREIALRRAPATSLLAAYLHSAPSLLMLLVATVIYANQTRLWPGTIAVYVLGALLLLRVIGPVYAWSTHRYGVDSSGLIQRRGLVFRVEQSTSWQDIASVNIDAPWAYRFFRLSIVTALAGGQNDTKFELTGMPEPVVAAIVRGASRSAPPLQPAAGKPDEPGPTHLLQDSERRGSQPVFTYRARVRDLVVSSFTYGSVFALGGAFLLSLVDLADQLGVISTATPSNLPEPAVLLGICAGTVLGCGLMISVLRFHGFVVRDEDGDLVISYGLLSTRVRRVVRDELCGVRVERNILEMALDRVRVVLVTRDSGGQLGTNAVFPSLPRQEVLALLERGLPGTAVGILDRRPLPELLKAVGTLALSGGVAWGATAVVSRLITDVWGVLTATFCLSLVLTALCVRVMASRVRLRGETLTWTSHALVDVEMVLRAEEIHAIFRVTARGGRLGIVHVHYFSGVPKSLLAPHHPADLTLQSAGGAVLGRERTGNVSRTDLRSNA